MKKKINLLVVVALSIFTLPVVAQGKGSLAKTKFRNPYGDNWLISVGPSANILFGEQDKFISPFGRMGLGGGLSVGKWFNANTGFSLNMKGGKLRGINLPGNFLAENGEYLGGYYTGGDPDDQNLKFPMKGDPDDPSNYKYYEFVDLKNGARGFWQSYNYFVATLDIMGNFTNLLRGYAIDENLVDVEMFAGLGLNFASNNGSTTPSSEWLAARFGVRASYNLDNNLGVFAEGAVYLTDPEFDGYRGTAWGDLYTNLTVGVQYTINKNISSYEGGRKTATMADLYRLNRLVNENRNLIKKHQAILKRQQNLTGKVSKGSKSEKAVPVIYKENSKSAVPANIYFSLNSYTIGKKELSKLKNVAAFLKSKRRSKVLMVGYADKLTGTPEYNYDLSKKRVEEVKKTLQSLGISSRRLRIEWKGDREQPFKKNELNRVVIIVERR
jgi:outer membrane protein OmpA-like peptidoglycan-associated protein